LKIRSNDKQTSALPDRIRLPGSGTPPGGGDDIIAGVTLVCAELSVTVVEPSRFTSMVKAVPKVVSVVSTGIVPAGSENMLKAKVLPEVDTPSGELSAGPYRLTAKEMVVP